MDLFGADPDENLLPCDGEAYYHGSVFGAERKFSFRNKATKEKVSVMLENGGLLDMKGETQRIWQHQLPKTKKVDEPRVNLTLRRMS
ncbi:MAG: alpha-ketoglutarate-dependent dioxygenase AlkB [Akkermansiaceae bacterium]|nr:alpha-ketoglutarate-dependent dioxygenase AlkB [Akkermansiaceae bacterium]